jgi:hypothetical protein
MNTLLAGYSIGLLFTGLVFGIGIAVAVLGGKTKENFERLLWPTTEEE